MERQELHAHLTDALRGVFAKTTIPDRAPGAQRVKSRLIEAHAPESSPDGVVHLLGTLERETELGMSRLDDGLWQLDVATQPVYLDTLNPRFWLLHTTASADALHTLVRKSFLAHAAFDSAWMPASQLDRIEGERQWLKSSFVADDLRPSNPEEATARRWKVQVEGDTPQKILDLVRRELPQYALATSLTAVGSLISEGDVGRAYVVADYQGRFISNGDSFDLIAGVLWRTLDRYQSFIQAIEERYRIVTKPDEIDALQVDGDVASLDLPHPIADVRGFVDGLFSCRHPFRLWAVPREVGPSEWTADAVDLHVGQPLRVEISPDRIRVLLEERTCGNTLARLVTNLQHRYDAQLELQVAA